MSLSQALLHHQTLFAIFIYCLSVVIVIPVFGMVHDRLDNYYLQFFWDKIGAPLLRTFLIIIFILLVYPLNFGLDSAPPVNELLNSDHMRVDFLINIIFILTFFFPLIPVIGKLEELIIPLQGMIASMIIFNWLCQALEINDYSIFPDSSVFIPIIIISLITHWLAEHLSESIGHYLDQLYDRKGFNILVFRCILLIMQCPIIFLFGLSLGKQLV